MPRPTRLSFVLLALFTFAAIPPVVACGIDSEALWLKSILRADDPASEDAQARLRQLGPAGLRLLLKARDNLLATPSSEAATEQTAALRRLEEAIDRVAGQRGAADSRLFWHTSLDSARDTAAAEEKPILSLRLLGKLTDELSCANSRFFRTTLYADARIADLLRDQFVLHWQSERPVPVVTVDFGDGRQLVRTVTGNSAHYLLDSYGRPLDALPGLYAAGEFQAWLQRSLELFDRYSSTTKVNPAEVLRAYHQAHGARILREWSEDLQALHRHPLKLAAQPGEPLRDTLVAATSAGDWRAMAAQHEHRIRVDAVALPLTPPSRPTAAEAATLAIAKSVVENPLVRMLEQFSRSVAEDTVRNEYLLHQQIHTWFQADVPPQDLESLNARVYAELFLTPADDPWLGLVPTYAYTGLELDGLR